MDHMEPDEPSLGLLLLGYALIALGGTSLTFQLGMMLRSSTWKLDWINVAVYVFSVLAIISGILLRRRDKRLMAELGR